MCLSSHCSHVILAFCKGSVMATFYLPVAEKSLESSSRKSDVCEEVRTEAVISNLLAPFITASSRILTWPHQIGSDNSLRGREEEKHAGSVVSKNHF